MSLCSTSSNNVQVYNVTGKLTSSLPTWLIKTNKRSLKRDPSWSQRLNLIQDFEFPQSCLSLRQSYDQKFIIATGIYKPQLRIFDLEEMTLKFDRHLTTEPISMELLAQDWKKLALLQSDRSIEFHTQFGLHSSIRIPKFGRDLKYQSSNCDLLVGGASNELYRFNLEEGMFKKSWSTCLKGINSIDINPLNELVCLGGVGDEECCIELWDHRSRNSVASLDISPHLSLDQYQSRGSRVEISKVKFISNDGISLTVGTSTGQILLYDLRTPFPLATYDHQYGLPIREINLHNDSLLITADQKSIRIWNKKETTLFTSIEPSHDLNSLLVHPNSGLLMAAVEDKQIQTWFIPSIGPAPKWCSFLENITEELEQNPTPQTWDNFKFVCKEELEQLGLENLLVERANGNNTIKPYMHGYFINYSVWKKAKLEQQVPQTLQELTQIQHQKQLAQMAKSRIESGGGGVSGVDKKLIGFDKKLPAINKNLATSLVKSKSTSKQQLLDDGRFSQLFVDEDFEIDEESEAYQLINPSRGRKETFDSDEEEIEGKKNEMKIKVDLAKKSDQKPKYKNTKRNEKHSHSSKSGISRERRKMRF